ncbi:MAG: hypothetical protein Q9217_001351 [Psora testacea]
MPFFIQQHQPFDLKATFIENKLHTDQFCASIKGTTCYAQKAGTYDLSHSVTAINVPNDLAGWNNWGSDDALLTQGNATVVLDSMSMDTAQGTFSIPNATITAVNSSRIILPGGIPYDTQVGLLTLGGPGKGIMERGPFHAKSHNFPSYLAQQNVTPTNSFGLHYGSASLKLNGSLIWGGYDRKRLIGPVGSWGLRDNKMQVPMIDIAIGVEQGRSPFDENAYGGLLRVNNSDHPESQWTSVNPVVPYLAMSPATCTAIAEHLPVTLQTDLGLYTWNTADPQYTRILRSAAYLSFTFTVEIGNLTIKVPFQLLNLTLEPPIVREPRPYFPCQPLAIMNSPGQEFILGRAFLQAAYVGLNWKSNFFLAQAPGPGVVGNDVASITPELRKLASNPIGDFASSWAQTWASTEDPPNSPDSAPNESARSSVLARSAKIALGVCIPIGVIGLIGTVLYYALWRKSRRPPEVPPKDSVTDLQVSNTAKHEKFGVQFMSEIGPDGLRHEIAPGNEIHEAG